MGGPASIITMPASMLGTTPPSSPERSEVHIPPTQANPGSHCVERTQIDPAGWRPASEHPIRAQAANELTTIRRTRIPEG
jgi:hypothetical protein